MTAAATTHTGTRGARVTQPTHHAARPKVSRSGYYVDTACGAYVGINRTEDRDQVTCRSCQRTHAFREVAGG